MKALGKRREPGRLQYGLCTVALVISSILLTSIRVLFADPNEKLADKDAKTERSDAAIKNSKKPPAASHTGATGQRQKEGAPLKRRNSCGTHEAFGPKSPVSRRNSRRALSVDARSVASNTLSEYDAVSREMNVVSGALQKQGDYLGFWKQRFFKLASFLPHELASINGIHPSLCKESGPRRYLLQYWACSETKAQTPAMCNSPRGAFLVRGCSIEKDEFKLVFVLSNLIDAMNLNQVVSPIKLCAPNVRAARRWVSGLTFASIMPPSSAQEDSIMPQKAGMLLLSPNMTKEAAFMYSFQLFRVEGVKGEKRSFLMCWDPTRQDASSSITPQSIYEVTKASVSIVKEMPDVLVLEHVLDNVPLNHFLCRGRLFLQAESQTDAVTWASSIVQDKTRLQIDPALCTTLPESSSTLLALSASEALVDEYIGSQECIVDELDASDLLAMNMKPSAISSSSTGSDYGFSEYSATPSSRELVEGFTDTDEDDMENQGYKMNYHGNSNFGLGNDGNKMQFQDQLFKPPNSGRLSPVKEEDSVDGHPRPSRIAKSAKPTATNWANRRRSLD
mmetsp:Transcript_2728/g.5297  ORF Transcript_2728/g.5297 Transcript_2728/m.5297 type:complete len:563 (-) Transcript_2728:89-1777(-)